MKELADKAARDAIAGDLDATLVVEAAAGTGKTTALVNRVLALLKSGRARLATLVAVTFTEKAAGEMKLRLRARIEEARRDPNATSDEQARLKGALEELEAAHIGTIHGFCAELLRQRPVQARVDPLFEAADEDAQNKLFDEAFEPWFQAALSDPPEGVRRVLRRRANDREGSGPRDLLRSAGRTLVETRDFDAPWRREVGFDRHGALDAIVARLHEVAALSPLALDADDWCAKSIAEIARFAHELQRTETIRGRDYDGLEERLRAFTRGRGTNFWGWKGRGKLFAKGIARDEVMAKRDALKADLDALLARCDADLAAALQHDLRSLVVAYEERKAKSGKLDFLDLLLVTRNLLRDDASVRRELQSRYSHLLVDEFQDTDPLQADILLLLAADDPSENDPARVHVAPGKLFVVGDPKQAIYRFRRADVALYEAIKRRLVKDGATLLHLTTSFRSAPSIQQAVNAAFSKRMQGSEDGAQAEYVPLQPYRDEPQGRPTVIALPIPRPYSDLSGQVTGWQIEQSAPDAVGAFVDWLVKHSGWTVTERERPEPAPIEPRHVCLLFRRFVNFGSDVTRPYVRALEARGIAHVLVGGRSYHAREEVLAIRNALAAIEWPDDELSVFAALRGPLFALGDDAILAFRRAYGSPSFLASLDPLRPWDDGTSAASPRRGPHQTTKLDDVTRPVHDALAVLRDLHRGRNKRPIADTVSRLLEATRAHAGLAVWPTGEQALANVLRVLDHARRFEAQGTTSFRAFVRRLEDDADRGVAGEAPVVEEGTDGVRMMTVHKAKGLEFPVVILCDPSCATTQREPSRYVDPARKLWAAPLAGCAPHDLLDQRKAMLRHDAEEGVRLLYVAATRARELLVVPVVGDAPKDGWVDALHPVLYPVDDDRRASKDAPGCPPFGDDSVYERPDRAKVGSDAPVRPGLHRAREGEHHVVWWDPAALGLGKEEDSGVRQQKVLAADERGAAQRGERAWRQWTERREAAIARGGAPTWRVAIATERRKEERAHDVDVRVEHTDAPRASRPHGTRFGALVHAVLATVDLAATEDEAQRAARVVGRMLGASDDEVAHAARATIAALAHPILAAARAESAACRRESPIAHVMDDGTIVEGILDLAYKDSGGWVVVDFKTDDAAAGPRAAEYARQVAMYASAVAAATGEPARAVLLGV